MITIGRIVHFTFDKERRDRIVFYPGSIETLGQSTTVPATIVAVHDDECVNLRVHPDGPGPDLWETSVPWKDQGCDDSYWDWPSRSE